ncbi:hypothetical protein K501DRAFT_324396 [Backusella circina FSU 941]|nr:hypothetical protein K501DRAFT_324396 [Backusella circina FSU 941]
MSQHTLDFQYLDNILSDRECVLFPTYAKRNPRDYTEWIVRTKGWALSHNCSTAKQKMMMGITKSVAGKKSADQKSSEMFEQRFKYFLATNKRNKQFLIQAVGTTILEDEPRITYNDDSDQNTLSSSPFIENSDYNQQYYKTDDTCWTTIASDDIHAGYFLQDPLVLPRPSNPVSSVLDNHSCGTNNTLRKKSNATNSITSSDYSSSTMVGDDYLEYIEDDEDDGQVKLKTKGTGFLSGQFILPHENVLNWAQDQNQCDARLIKIQSVCTDSNKFSANQGIVNLIEPTGISVISDIDDTIKDTKILSGARTVLSKTFFEAPQSVEGMSDVYMAWYSHGASFHYVSNSPFQLMPMLDKFIRHSQFPPGSMHLRDESSLLARLVEVPGQAKREAIIDIIKDFPSRQFILVGDSGEIDLEIYTKIATLFPHQILKIYIRDVTTPSLRRSASAEDASLKRKPSAFSSFFPKRHSTTSSFSSAPSSFDDKASSTSSTNGKFRSPFGMRRAVTSTLAELAVEPRLTGHKTLHRVTTAPAMGNTSLEACAQLYERIEKARLQVPHIDVILFQDAQTLADDPDISDALWKYWDQHFDDSAYDSSSSSSSSPSYSI